VGAEPEAPGVDFLDSIDFKVHDEAGAERVAYLVKRNDSHRKEISVFFLPQILPDESPRAVVITYRWPGMVKRLLALGDEQFSLTMDSRTRVSQFKYSVFFHPKLHKSYALDCRRESAEITGESLEVNTEESGEQGWTYKVSNAPAEGFTYQLRLTARQT
jgi:hypothetical protein